MVRHCEAWVIGSNNKRPPKQPIRHAHIGKIASVYALRTYTRPKSRNDGTRKS